MEERPWKEMSPFRVVASWSRPCASTPVTRSSALTERILPLERKTRRVLQARGSWTSKERERDRPTWLGAGGITEGQAAPEQAGAEDVEPHGTLCATHHYTRRNGSRNKHTSPAPSAAAAITTRLRNESQGPWARSTCLSGARAGLAQADALVSAVRYVRMLRFVY